jgi:hypothetical protein
MRLRPLVLAFGVAFAASPAAWAQLQLTSTTGSVSLESMSTGAGRQLTMKGLASGLKLGEAAILHAGLFADIGYDSNVFYSASQGSSDAPVLHITPRLEITNAERDGSIPSGTYYDVFATVDYRKYLNDDSNITEQDAVNPSLGGVVEFSSGQTLGLMLSESFSRFEQAAFSSGKPVVRDDNMVSAGLRYAPGGGRLRFNIRFNNLIDMYEGDYKTGSNMGNEGVLDVGWRWLPKTTLYVQVAQGVITYFNSSPDHASSYPLRTMAGLRGLLTEKLAVNIGAGYSNPFYSSGENPSGFGNVGIVTEINYSISVLSRAGLGYHHDFANSPFVGHYYNSDAIYGAYQQMVASRVVTYLFGRYENRRFGALPSGTKRTDNYIVGGVSVDYMIRNFILAGVSYSLNLNRTQETGPTTGGIDYTKHVLLLRLGVVY